MQPEPVSTRVSSLGRDDAVSAISSIAYGFIGSQALFAALEIDLFSALADEPCGLDALAAKLSAPAGPLSVLLTTCAALGLVEWDGERYANSPGAQRFLSRASRSYVGDYYLRQVSSILYPRLPSVRSLLRGEVTEGFEYAALYNPGTTEDFIRGQHVGSLGPATLLARSDVFEGASHLLDLGGGSGAFSIEAVKTHPRLSAIVLDFPQVVSVATKIIEEAGLTEKITCASGDLRTDPWPSAADVILLSYIVSCYEPRTLRALLARAYSYLPSGGRLVIHDFALNADKRGPYNAALFLFGQLTASAQTHGYTVDELATAMREQGYESVASRSLLPDLTFLVSGRKP
ncbi:MAG TPA: methyltransferase [Ktedonobacterales bacterium]|nr:methyltransferase [Ktedonobacterales bacterium]